MFLGFPVAEAMTEGNFIQVKSLNLIYAGYKAFILLLTIMSMMKTGPGGIVKWP